MTRAAAGTEQRLVLEIPDAAGARLIELELNAGRIYHAIVGSPAAGDTLIEQTVNTSIAAIVPADGGLIGNLKVWENLVLPAAYHAAPRYSELEQRAACIFAELGIGGERCESICRLLPDHLDRFERRLAAFVRAMLSEPEIIVYDSPFEGLSRAQIGEVLRFDGVYHRSFPLGTSLFVTPDLPHLPDMGAHRVFHP